MTHPSRLGFAWSSAVTIFISAFLLFQVQPIISKMILPWFGGGPAVWTTCMLFFQVVLLAGYGYAHGLTRMESDKWRTVLHVTILVVALAMLPIIPDSTWKPADSSRPTWRILLLLGVNIGLPYFVLAATSPLVQTWFSRVCVGRSPYRLYALSNVGSLGALLTYPFLVESTMTTALQGRVWSLMFAVFAILSGGLALATYRTVARDNAGGGDLEEASVAPTPASPPSSARTLAWLLLPALASMMLLAVTNHMCQDVAVVPFFWVVPLSLYLLSFIICFDRELWYRRRIFAVLAGCAVLFVSALFLEDDLAVVMERFGWEEELFEFTESLAVEASIYLSLLFFVCMVCHGELVRTKPPANQLTAFYLMVATGGALGGIFVALVCPQLFASYAELRIGLVLAFMLAMGVLWDSFWDTWLLNRLWKKCVLFAVGFVFLLVVVRAQYESIHTTAIVTLRNFYGILSVKEFYEDEPDRHIFELLNGRILHGSQFQEFIKSRMPTTYYDEQSGVGLALLHYRSTNPPSRVAVVGLGTGSLAAYGGRGDFYCFYEINPNVIRIAQEYFTYLKDSSADVKLMLGDARLSMERQEPQRFDIIALDAFSGDAIPVHLLTKEAFELYFRHLTENGIVAVHVSNRHLDLEPVIGRIAKSFQVPAVLIEAGDNGSVGDAASDWILITRNTEFLEEPAIAEECFELEESTVPLWTDDYSNLFQIMD